MRIIFTEGFLLNDLYQGLSSGGYCVLALSHFFPLQCFLSLSIPFYIQVSF